MFVQLVKKLLAFNTPESSLLILKKTKTDLYLEPH
jgi:hypothetical protein